MGLSGGAGLGAVWKAAALQTGAEMVVAQKELFTALAATPSGAKQLHALVYGKDS